MNRVLPRLQTQFDEQLGGIGGLLADGGHLCPFGGGEILSTSAAGSLRPAQETIGALGLWRFDPERSSDSSAASVPGAVGSSGPQFGVR